MLAPNTVLQSRYRSLRLLGQGGMGAVYQAQDLRLNQIVALKENLGGDARQFQQEALLLANLRHPNLPRVSDHFFEPSGAQYLLMDFVEGEDLQSRLDQQGAMPEAEVIKWFDQILDAAAYLHSRGVIHRDIKPANIKIMPTGQAVLVDFGIAKVFQPGQFTMSGAKAVSPGFAAPEQYRGGTDQRSDIYSLGATLYALLTGSAPPDAQALERRTATLTPPRILSPTMSMQSEQAILRAMELDTARRWQTASEFRAALMPSPPIVTMPTRSAQPLPPIAPQSPVHPASASTKQPRRAKAGSWRIGLGIIIFLIALGTVANVISPLFGVSRSYPVGGDQVANNSQSDTTPTLALTESSPIAVPSIPAGWKLHQGSSFQISLPASWEEIPLDEATLKSKVDAASTDNPHLADTLRAIFDSGQFKSFLFYAADKTSANIITNVSIARGPTPNGTSPQQAEKDYADALPQVLKGSKLVAVETALEINGLKAGEVDYDLPLVNAAGQVVTLRGVQYLFFLNSGEAYVVTVTGDASDAERFMSLARQIGRSFVPLVLSK